MLNCSVELEKAKEIGKSRFGNLERLWSSLPKDKREQITELTECLKSHGAICSVYDFI